MAEPIISKLSEFLESLTATHYYAFSAVTLIVGYSIDGLGLPGLWGMRSGAVVAGAIAFCFFSDLRQHESWWKWLRNDNDDKIEEAEQPLRDARAVAKLMKASGVDGNKARAHETKAFLETRPIVKAHRKDYWDSWSKARRALSAQGYCIAVGTFVWAFGDLPVTLLRCGKVTC